MCSFVASIFHLAYFRSLSMYQTSFFLIAKKIPFYRYNVLFIRSSIGGHLGCSYFFIIMTNAAMNTHVEVCVNMCLHFSWVQT